MHCENTPKKSSIFFFTVSFFLGFPTILTALAFQSCRFFGGVLFCDISIYFHVFPSSSSSSSSSSSFGFIWFYIVFKWFYMVLYGFHMALYGFYMVLYGFYMVLRRLRLFLDCFYMVLWFLYGFSQDDWGSPWPPVKMTGASPAPSQDDWGLPGPQSR